MKRDETPMWNDPNEPAYVRELLQAGRTETFTYDAAAGLAKHVALVQAGAPLPYWAQAGAAAGSSAWLGWLVMPIVAATAATGIWFATHPTHPTQPEQHVSRPVVAISAPVVLQPTAAAPAAAEQLVTPVPVVSAVPAVATTPRISKLHVAAPKAAHASAISSAKLSADLDKPSFAARPTTVRDGEPTHPAVAAREELAAREEVVAPAAEQHETQKTVAQEQQQASESQLEREMQMLAVAQRVLLSDPARALRLAEQGEHEFPRTMFSAERKQLALLAMVKLDRVDEARRTGLPFLAKYPNAPWSARLKRALATGRVD